MPSRGWHAGSADGNAAKTAKVALRRTSSSMERWQDTEDSAISDATMSAGCKVGKEPGQGKPTRYVLPRQVPSHVALSSNFVGRKPRLAVDEQSMHLACCQAVRIQQCDNPYTCVATAQFHGSRSCLSPCRTKSSLASGCSMHAHNQQQQQVFWLMSNCSSSNPFPAKLATD